MNKLPLALALSAALLTPFSGLAQDAAPAASSSAPAMAAPAPATTDAATPAPAAPDASATGRRGGRGGRPAPLTAANNHIETPATGAIWIPSPNSNAIGKYPFGPDSIVQPGVPQGTLNEFVFHSQLYPKTLRRVSVYVPAQYDPKVPACLMVFQDGVRQYSVRADQKNIGNTAEYRVPTVIDNLTARKELPVIVCVFIDPGSTAIPATGKPRAEDRSLEYDTVDDRYYQFLSKELLPMVEKQLNIRKDPAGRAICGISSGAICAFNVACNHPDQFGNVLSDVGSFTNIRGGNIFPSLVKNADKKPIKVFLSDGTNDNRNPDDPTRDWYLQNKQMYENLRDKGYEVRYVLGENVHGSDFGGPIFPDSIRWLWSDQLPKADAAPAQPAASATSAAPAAAK